MSTKAQDLTILVIITGYTWEHMRARAILNTNSDDTEISSFNYVMKASYKILGYVAFTMTYKSNLAYISRDSLCGVVVRVPEVPGSIPGATTYFLGSSGSGTWSTRPRDN
jgi:hypothetical protein